MLKKLLKAWPLFVMMAALMLSALACGGSGGNDDDGGNGDTPTKEVNDGGDNGGDDGGDNGGDDGGDSGDEASAVETVLDEFMTALSEKDYERGYELFAIEFEGDSSPDALQAWVEENAVFPVSWQYDPIEIDGDTANARLEVAWEDGTDIPMLLTFEKDGSDWRITAVDFENP